MNFLYLVLITALLATSDGQYYRRNRPRRRMQSFDVANNGEGDGDESNGEGNSNGNGHEICNKNGNGNGDGCGKGSGEGEGEARSGCGRDKNRGGGGGSSGACGKENPDRVGGSPGGCGRNEGNSNPWSQIERSNKLPGNPENAKQRSSGIAIQAAKEAKKANDDMAPAVKAAADKIKCEYADKATAAANAADAVLFGKGQLLEQLEAEVCNARALLAPEVQKLTTYEENDQLANKALSQSKRQLKTLSDALKTAKEKLNTMEQVLEVWEKSVMSGCIVMEAAQKRVNKLMTILNEVLQDREKTKKAAEIAARAAQEAQNRVQQMDNKSEGTPCPDSEESPGRQRRAWQYYNQMFAT
ncbi:hypothetical protein KR059_008659 [Drosophila kikkawai]|nr:hypothetical protein KR059_008659 [Drosophila kikkawai]